MNKFKDILTADEINSLIEEKAYTHTHYYHYSDLAGIKGILKNQNLWISSMCFSNDAAEHSKFGNDTYRYFQLCFSTGTTENLPLWFLYSGINGNGARISFSKSSIKRLIDFKTMKIELVNTLNNSRTFLLPGTNCSVEFKDVLYRKKENEKYRLKYNTQSNNSFPAIEMAEIEKKNIGFLKEIVWFYEKETRLLIKVKEDLIDKSLFKKATKSPYRIELSIPDDCYKDISVVFSPVFDEKTIDAVLKDESFIMLNKAKCLSEYAGQIKIDLCGKCDMRKKS